MTQKQLMTKLVDKYNLVEEELQEGYSINRAYQILIEDVIKLNLPILTNYNHVNNFVDLKNLEKAVDEISYNIKKINKEIEITEYFKTNKHFDTKKLKKDFINRGLKEKFPKFNIDRFLHYIENPLLEIETYNGEVIEYDHFLVKKIMIGLTQMIFDEMDMYILNIGKEGSGKSCWSSQQILYYYTILKDVGLIEYEYDIKRLFFTDIVSFLQEHERQTKNDYFRIECMDEGNELNRSNFHDESMKQFKYEMRTERKMLRIILINMQQLGELDTSISLSRVNFIFDCKMEGNKKLGTLKKGYVDMYIIPRDKIIYSDRRKKNLSQIEILNGFAKKLDNKKDYYVSLPREFVIRELRFKNQWGFNKDVYDDHVKDQLHKRKFSKTMKITDLQAFSIYEKMGGFGKLGFFDLEKNLDRKLYDAFKGLYKKINSYFESNPEKIISLKASYGKK